MRQKLVAAMGCALERCVERIPSGDCDRSLTRRTEVGVGWNAKTMVFVVGPDFDWDDIVDLAAASSPEWGLSQQTIAHLSDQSSCVT